VLATIELFTDLFRIESHIMSTKPRRFTGRTERPCCLSTKV
jgi:hypothetical protein